MATTQSPVTIESLAYGGDGVGRIEDKIVFVPDTVPGDSVIIDIVEDKGSFYRGRLKSMVEESPRRIRPFCPYADKCGGCQWQMMEYDAQTSWKRTIVAESIQRISGIEGIRVDPCVQSSTSGFRTTARYPAVQTKQGLIFGYYERRSHRIVDIEHCPVAVDGINEAASVIRDIFSQQRVQGLKELTIRSGAAHRSYMITVTTESDKKITSQAKALLSRLSHPGGVVQRNAATGRVVGAWGEQYRFDTLGGIQFRIGEDSFFQINAAQAERLVELARDMLAIEPDDIVVDGFGGVGLFSLAMCGKKNGIRLYDLSKSAVEDSIFNASEHGFGDFSAYIADTKDAVQNIGAADRLIIDPPRPGIGKEGIEALATLGARTVAYVSCNPTTLARDIGYFAASGYTVEHVVPVDMFPHTYHIEAVAHLTKNG